MRTAALIGSLLISVCTTPALADWQAVKVPTYGYSAVFPAPPESESHVDGGVKLHSNSSIANGTLCIVVVGDYGHAVDREEEFAANRNNFVRQVGATFLSQRRITLPKGEAKVAALTFDAQSDWYVYRSIIAIEGAKIYQVAGRVARKGGDAKNLDRCTKGFKLLAP